LSLSVGGFDEGVTGNMGIGAFLVKGEEAQSLKRSSREGSTESPPSKPPEREMKAESASIRRFFYKASSNNQEEAVSHTAATWALNGSEIPHGHGGERAGGGARNQPDGDDQRQEPIDVHMCSRCHTRLKDADELQYHQDEHLARDLQEEERGRQTFAALHSSAITTPVSNRGTAASSTRPTKRKKTEAGQTKLKFA
jgi:DNA polymerase eta